MTDAEARKYYAARYVYPRRTGLTPKNKVTWVEWWNKMFNDDYDQYINRIMKEKKDE